MKTLYFYLPFLLKLTARQNDFDLAANLFFQNNPELAEEEPGVIVAGLRDFNFMRFLIGWGSFEK